MPQWLSLVERLITKANLVSKQENRRSPVQIWPEAQLINLLIYVSK